MALAVAEISLVSPLGMSASEHVFFYRAEVTPDASGAFTSEEGEPLPIHDCTWIPATRPWSSRLCLLAKHALARSSPASASTPILLIAPERSIAGDAFLPRFFQLTGHRVCASYCGAAAFAQAFADAATLLRSEPEVVILAVDSLLERDILESWIANRYSTFTRNPYPPSEGAAALRLVSSARQSLAGRILGYASDRSDATDDNDLPTDGAALTRAFASVGMPAVVPLVVGPADTDALRARDYQLAAIRHYVALDTSTMVGLEKRIGLLGVATGLMSAVFGLAWLRHGLPTHPDAGVALAWARSQDGTVAAATLGRA